MTNPQTHDPTPQTAARLREMAEMVPSMGSRTRAALLAGAAALEAVEVAREALRESVCMCEQLGREHMDVCAKRKALARLEAL